MSRLAVLALSFTLAGCAGQADPPAAKGPSPDKEGATWTDKELIAFLKTRGAAPPQTDILTEKSMGHGGVIVGPWLLVFSTQSVKDARALIERRRAGKPRRPQPTPKGLPADENLTPEEASDLSFEGVFDNGGFSWGRFAFAGDGAATLRAVKDALR